MPVMFVRPSCSSADSNIALALSSIALELTGRDEAYQLVDVARAGAACLLPARSEVHLSVQGGLAWAALIATTLDAHFPRGRMR